MFDRLRFAAHVLFARSEDPPLYALPSCSPLREEPQAAITRSAAMSMLDEETYAFLLVTIRRAAPELLKVEIQSAVREDWWPAIRETCARIQDVTCTSSD